MTQDPRDIQELIARLNNEIENQDFSAALSTARDLHEILVILRHEAAFVDPIIPEAPITPEAHISEPAIETIKDIVAQIDPQGEQVDSILDFEPEFLEMDKDEDDFEALTKDFKNLPEFDPVEFAPSAPPKEKNLSLNETLRPNKIALDLNDRLAFMKHLFGGKSGDFERIIDMLDDLDTYEEAVDFVQSTIKPDYNNWEGKAEYEDRLMMLIANKFGQ